MAVAIPGVLTASMALSWNSTLARTLFWKRCISTTANPIEKEADRKQGRTAVRCDTPLLFNKVSERE